MEGKRWRRRPAARILAVAGLCFANLSVGAVARGAESNSPVLATSPVVRAPINVPAELIGRMSIIENMLKKHGLSLGDSSDPSALQLSLSFDPNLFHMVVSITLSQPGRGVVASGEAVNPGFGTGIFHGAVVTNLTESASKQIDEELDRMRLTLANTPDPKACVDGLSNRSDLAPLADKVELVRSSNDAAPPFRLSTNDNFPSDSDLPLIAIWAEARDACLKEQFARFPATSGDTLGSLVYQQEVAFIRESAASVSALIVALYQRKLTYGEFAQKRYEITRDISAADRQFRTAVLNADADRQLQARQLAEATLHDRLTAWTAYMQAVQSRQPLTVRLEGNVSVGVHANCTSTASGGLVSTNCN
jgi:hypothetical protein